MRDSKRAEERKKTCDYAIYIRIDPRDRAIRYVGLTCNLRERSQQILRCPGENLRLDAWIQELQIAGLLPITEVLETVRSWGLAMERENYWIQHYVQQGAILLNARIRGGTRARNKWTGQKLS